jgi:hypothetical protein
MRPPVPSPGRADSGAARDRCADARASAQRGAVLFLTFLLMLIVSGLAFAVGVFAWNSQLTGKSAVLDKQAFHIAEAGLQRARQALVAETWTAATGAGNTYTESFGAGQYQVTIVDNGDDTYTITSGGYVGSTSTYSARRQVIAADVPVTESNTNKALTATASASSVNGSHTAGKANDDSMSTYWEAGTNGSGQWLAMDHGSATTVDQIIVEENNRIDGVTIEYSSDGSSWSTVPGLSVVESPAKTWTCDFDATSARYFRGVFTASGSSRKVSVEEFQAYDTTAASVTLDGNGTFSTSW